MHLGFSIRPQVPILGCRTHCVWGYLGEQAASLERQPSDGEELMGMKVSIRRPDPSTAAWLSRALQEHILGWPGTEASAKGRHPKQILGLLGRGWNCCPPLGAGGRAPSPSGTIPSGALLPLVFSKHPGAEPHSSSRLGSASPAEQSVLSTQEPDTPSPSGGRKAEEKGEK